MSLFIFDSKKKNIFSSRSFYWYLPAFVFFYLCFLGSFLIFLFHPQPFYFRSWEYFEEFVFHIPNAKAWDHSEIGDLSRNYLFSYQEQYPTYVSCDSDGFRSVPIQADSFPILVVGDSHTWGYGVSDDGTIPWILAKTLHVPVFNGGRYTNNLPNILGHPRVKKAKVIIELVAELSLKRELFSQNFHVNEFRGRQKSYFHVFDVHPKRYFVLFKALRYLNPLTIVHELNHRIRIPQQAVKLNDNETDVMQAVANIEKRAQILNEMGYEYIFGIIPNKDFTVSNKKDATSRRLQTMRNAMLEKRVHFVDLNKIFNEVPDPQKLYLPYDSHINANGSALIAQALAFYLKQSPEIFSGLSF